MTKPVIAIETEFELMADFQLAIESKSVIVENALDDKFRYSLYSITDDLPTYDEYMNGNDFEEDELIATANSKDELVLLQRERRTL